MRNLDDFRWYDGYFASTSTDHFDPAELNWLRWKVRRDVLGMWRATKADWKYFTGYSVIWELGLRPLVWLSERMKELMHGVEGRYKLQMKHFLDLNDFAIEVPGYERRQTYHPVFGDNSDPHAETCEQMLERPLQFTSPRKPSALPGAAAE